MARQKHQRVARHDDFLSESDLSPSSGEEDAPLPSSAPYRDAPSRSSLASRKRGDSSASDDSSAAKKGYAAAPVLGSSDEDSEEDEEKLVGTGRTKHTTKGKRQKKYWVMNSGVGAALPGQQPASSNTGLIIGIIVFVLIVGIAAGGYYAYTKGIFDSNSSTTDTSSGSGSGSGTAAGTTHAATSAAAGTSAKVSSAASAGGSSAASGASSGSAVSGASSGSVSASDSAASATGSAASTSASTGAGDITLETLTTTLEDGSTTTMVGFESIITDGGEMSTTFIETTAASGASEGASASETGPHHGDSESTDSSGEEGGMTGLPNLWTATLATEVDGKATTLNGMWEATLIGGSEASSRFITAPEAFQSGGGGDERTRRWVAQAARAVPPPEPTGIAEGILRRRRWVERAER